MVKIISKPPKKPMAATAAAVLIIAAVTVSETILSSTLYAQSVVSNAAVPTSRLKAT